MTEKTAIKAVGHQYLPDKQHLDNLYEMVHRDMERSGDVMWIALGTFHYGVMVGTQQERARRREAARRAEKRAAEKQGAENKSAEKPTTSIPVLDIPMMSDYKWQKLCLEDRLEHPEKYENSEDVQETISHLRKWLAEHNPDEPDSEDGAGLSEWNV